MKSIPIFQVYKSVLRIPKTEYTPEMRAWLKEHRGPFASLNGYMEDGILHLPNSYKSNPDLNACNLILIQDDFAEKFKETNTAKASSDFPEWWLRRLQEKPNIYFSPRQNYIFRYEVFLFRKDDDAGYSLSINYNENALLIGDPKREDHDIAHLKEGDVLRYRINGQNNFSMTGRRQRTYAEFDYLLHYVGQAHSIEFDSPNQIERVKTPPQATKEVDERKHFY